jgi:MFS family permease
LYSSAFVMLAYPVLGVILPVIFEQAAAPQRLGLLLMAFSIGSIIGALGYSALGHRLHQRLALLVGIAGGVLAIAWFAVDPPYGWLIAGAVLGGLMTGPVNPVVNFVLQLRTPEELRGRVMGVTVSVAYGVVPLGYLLAGIVVAAIGAQPTLVIITGLGLLLLAAAVRDHQLRRLDDHRSGVAELARR